MYFLDAKKYAEKKFSGRQINLIIIILFSSYFNYYPMIELQDSYKMHLMYLSFHAVVILVPVYLSEIYSNNNGILLKYSHPLLLRCTNRLRIHNILSIDPDHESCITFS